MLKQIPNLLTLMRMLLVGPFTYFLLDGAYHKALTLFFIAGVSDAVDGFLARQFHWRSRFGAIADPLADKLLLVSSYLALAWMEVIPWWLVSVVFGRDLMIVIGGLVYHFRFGRFDIQPSILGKLCTFVQIAFVIWLLLNLSGYPLFESDHEAGLFAVCAVTLASGIHYFILWVNKARLALRETNRA